MAKRRSSKNNPTVSSSALPSLPGVSDDPSEVVTPPAAKPIADIPQTVAEIAKPKPPPKRAPQTIQTKVAELRIDVPVLVCEPSTKFDASYKSPLPLRVDSKRLTAKQAIAAKAVLGGLVHANTTLANGKTVKDRCDIVAFWLDQVYQSMVDNNVVSGKAD